MVDWIGVKDRLPEPCRLVLVRQKTGYQDNSVTVIGQWIPAKTMESNADDDGWVDYDCDSDTHYVPEGWYESQTNWGEFANIHINESVTHWMPLPEPPENKE